MIYATIWARVKGLRAFLEGFLGVSSANSDAESKDTPDNNLLPLRRSKEIQGDILAGFRKDHNVFFFYDLNDCPDPNAWLAELLPKISTTDQVQIFNDRYGASRTLPGQDNLEILAALWVNVSLTYSGLIELNSDLAPDIHPFTAFREGPSKRAWRLGDRGLDAPTNWVVGGPHQGRVDAVLRIAADRLEDLDIELDKQRALATKHGITTVSEQRGDTLPGLLRGHEHFGFKDGISQPDIRGFDEIEVRNGREKVKARPGSEIIAAGEFILGYDRQSGESPDPVPDWLVNGSFQVFRRLGQDVPGWRSQVSRKALLLAEDAAIDDELLAAKLMGRWRSGTPLARSPKFDDRAAKDQHQDNNFNFEDDQLGHKTPRFSHIRKMRPRSKPFHDDRRRIIRRGIPFGPPFDPESDPDHGVDVERGLLFVAYMASIEDQFEFLQWSWANDLKFPSKIDGLRPRDDGPDPIVGNAPAPCRFRRRDTSDRHVDLKRFVRTTGAVYSFAPSLTTLRRLAERQL